MRMAQLFLVLASAVALAGCPKRSTTVPEGSGAAAGSQGAATRVLRVAVCRPVSN